MLTRSQTKAQQKRTLSAGDSNLNPKRAKSPLGTSSTVTEDGSSPEATASGSKSSSSSNGTLQTQVNITVSNEFGLLQDEGDDDDDEELPLLTPRVPPGNGKNKGCATLPSKEKKVRVPPITVLKQTTKQLRELMTKCVILQSKYHMKATKTGVTLICADDVWFHKTVEALKENQVEFHTYTPADQQPMKVVLSGLPVFDEFELEMELLDLGVQPTEVKLFSRKVVGLEESALYLLHFPKGTVKLADLQKVKAVFNILVKWRYFERKPSDAVQCHRCQRFGHGMRNCNLAPLCVKCGEKHFSVDCRLPKKADLSPSDKDKTRSAIKCANCSGQHTANYRGCPTRKHYLAKLAEKKAEIRNAKPPPLGPPRNNA